MVSSDLLMLELLHECTLKICHIQTVLKTHQSVTQKLIAENSFNSVMEKDVLIVYLVNYFV